MKINVLWSQVVKRKTAKNVTQHRKQIVTRIAYATLTKIKESKQKVTFGSPRRTLRY